MKNINLTLITKYWKEGAIIILLFVCFFACNRTRENDNLNLSNEILKENVKKSEIKLSEYDGKIKTSKEKIKELDILEENAKDNIEILVDEVAKKENQYILLAQKEKQLKNIIKKYNTSDIANYFIDRYKIQTAVNTLPMSVVLHDTVSKLLINDLVSFDVTKLKLKYSKELLHKKDSIIIGKDTIISIKENKIFEYKKIIDEKDNIIYVNNSMLFDKDAIINNNTKIIKKEKRKVTKISILALILTGLLIVK